MFNPAILKKKKATDVVKMDKEDSKYALESMAPEKEDKEEEMPKKGMGPEAKLEIEIMLQAAKKKKK